MTRPDPAWPWPSIVLYATGQTVLATATTTGHITTATTWTIYAAWTVCGLALIAANTLSIRARAQR